MMHNPKFFPVIEAFLLLSCVALLAPGYTNHKVGFHNFVNSLEERRTSGWPIPDTGADLVGFTNIALLQKKRKV